MSWCLIGIYDGGTPLTVYYGVDNAGRHVSSYWSNNGGGAYQLLVDGYTRTYSNAGSAEVTDLSNNTIETITYNSGLQPYSRVVTNPGVIFNLQYLFNRPGDSKNNGNIWRIDDDYQSVNDQAFTYDWLGRVKTFSSPNVGDITWTYDRFGNRPSQDHATNPTFDKFLAISTASNRITTAGYGYAGAGNLTAEPGRTYQYDANGQIKSVNSGSTAIYSYDGDGLRAKRLTASESRYYYYDPAGNPVWEYKPGVGWDVFNLYFNGKFTATNTVTDGLLWIHTDHLGNPRLKTLSNGTERCRTNYLPFGEQLGTSCDNVKYKFTGKERDTETGLDNFLARYYSSAQGRFTTPDDVLNDMNPADPAGWNRYAYVRNNPLRYVDPDGRVPVETILDIASLGASVWGFAAAPSWSGAGYVAWDAASVFLPYVPGSWVRRVAHMGYSGLQAAKGAVRLENALEMAAAKNYLSSGVGLLAAGDKQVRQVLGISKADSAADFLGVTQGGRYVIGEAKGGDIGKAVSQLDKTAAALLAKQGDVKFSAEVILKKGQKLGDDNYKVSGNQLLKYNGQKWEVVKVRGQAVRVTYLK